jgi:hypothetical protein
MYRCDEHSSNPNKRAWQRTATAIDEAVTYRLHQKIRATFDSELWRETAAQQLAEVEDEKRRLQMQIQALDRAMEDVVNNLASLQRPNLIAQLEQRYTQMELERERFLNQIVAVETANRLVALSAFEEMQRAVDNWHLLTRDEQRKIVLMLIERIEIPDSVPHRDLTARIIWFDGSSNEFTVRRTIRKDQVWTLAEIDTVIALVKAGATQLEIASALPKRRWETIRRRIRLHFGVGVRIPGAGLLERSESYESYTHRVGGTQSSSTPN